VTVQVSAALAVGSRSLLVAFAGGLERFFGVPGITDFAFGVVVPVFGLEITAPVALAAGVPIGIVGGYVLVQTIVGLGYRIRQPDVQPAALSVGQRYPPFAHTPELANSRTRGAPTNTDGASHAPTDGGRTADASAGAGSSEPAATGATTDATDDGGTTPEAIGGSDTLGGDPAEPADSEPDETGTVEAGTDEAGTDETDQEIEEASDTRVFTPPDAADEIEEAPAAFADDADSNAGTAGPTVCPDCGRDLDDDEYTFCPRCGADVSD
jgi:hypothetical protein